MNRVRFYKKKIKPLKDKAFRHYRKHGNSAVTHSYLITWLKEAEFRFTCGTDDRHDDVPFFDIVDPEWFFQQLVEEAEWGDQSANIFIPQFDMGYEYWRDLMKSIEDLWHETHDENGKEIKKDENHDNEEDE